MQEVYCCPAGLENFVSSKTDNQRTENLILIFARIEEGFYGFGKNH
jgi:hypothetical protein